VVQPEQSASPQMRSLPRNTVYMPVGVAANSVGLGGGSGRRLRRSLVAGIALMAVLALAFGVWIAATHTKPLHEFSLNNGAYTYNFLFYKSSETVNLVGGAGLKSGSKAFVIAKPTSDEVTNDCNKVGKKWKQAFTVSVEGTGRPVCSIDDNVFLVMFTHGKAKHLFEITYTSPQAASTADVRQIMQSIKVSFD